MSVTTLLRLSTSMFSVASSSGVRPRATSKSRDEEFRDRYYASVDFAGGVNADAIRAALLQNVEGIMDAKAFESRTNSLPLWGKLLPVFSVVYGGLSGDIAQQIYSILAGGIQTYGEISVQVLTASHPAPGKGGRVGNGYQPRNRPRIGNDRDCFGGHVTLGPSGIQGPGAVRCDRQSDGA